MREHPEFSVVLPTYRGDTPAELARAIDSIEDQTIPPTELFIVKDGPLDEELRTVIENKISESSVNISSYRIEKNQGLGNALRVGVKHCSYDVVARMDADDISVPTRFEQQLEYLSNNSNIDIVGGYIEEFDSDPNEPIAKRTVPTDHENIKKTARFRSPMNHATVMFDKQTVMGAGNYRPVRRMEDYDLWVRMILNDAMFANIPEVLVKVSAGEEMYGRRGGLEYAREEVRTQIEFYRRGFISLPVFIFNTLTRTSLRLIPNQLRSQIYEMMVRDQI